MQKVSLIIIFNILPVVPFKYIAANIVEAAYKIPNICN